MQFEWTNSLQDVDTSKWDKDLLETYILHQSKFLSVLEQSKINNSKLYFFRAYKNQELIASAVVAVFEMDLDLFIQENKLVKTIKKVFPNLFKIKLIFCGTPISVGHQNIWVKDLSNINFLEICVGEISRKMQEIANKERIKFSAFKEFDLAQADIFEPILKKYGFVRCWSSPSINLNLEGANAENYWANLSHQQRRQMNCSLKKIGFSFQYLTLDTFSAQNLCFTLQSLPHCSSKEFYEKYIFVMQRAKVKLETLNQTFFDVFLSKCPKVNCLA